MAGLAIVLFVIFVILTIVTLVGHGIWALLAAIFGGGRKPSTQTCPFCSRSTPASHVRCDWCDKDLGGPAALELRDLAAVRRQLQRFREKGTLKAKEVDRLLGRLQDYREQLLHPVAKKPTQPIGAALVVDEVKEDRPSVVPPVLPPLALQPEAARPSRPESPVAARPPTPYIEPANPSVDSQLPVRLAAYRAADEANASFRETTSKPHVPAARMPVVKPLPPALPSRSWSEVLAAFMEQRNIRWGELIGGLLFVCSSVALVVSLWETLERIPYSKFFIFVSISSAVFGVGLYAHYRWKLESTSRALLVIATLLVPLNFVAMASMAKGEWTVLTMASELVSLTIFTYLVGQAMRILAPDGRWPTTAVVLGDSIAVLLAARLVRDDSPAWLVVGTGILPVALFAGAVGCYLYSRFDRPSDRGSWRPLRLTDSQIGFVFTLLGITAFSTVVALSLLVARAVTPHDVALAIAPRHVAVVLQRLSVLLAVTGVPILAGGLTVMRGSRRDTELAAYHLAGTILALVAMLVMLAGLAFAWPAPGWLIAVALLNTVALVFAAFRWRLPVLHTGVISCAALAYLITFYLSIGELSFSINDPYGVNMLRLLIGAKSGTALAGLFLALAAVSELLARLGRRRHGVIYLGGCGVVAVAGLLLVTLHGIRTGGADALRAAILYSVYGAGCLALTARWRRLGLSYLGLTLVTTAALWALWWQSAAHHVGPIWPAVLAIEALVMAAVGAVLGRYGLPLEAGQAGDKAGGRQIGNLSHTRQIGNLPHSGVWYDPWKLLDEDQRANSWPRSKNLSLIDVYRIPLVHVGEAAALIAAALAVFTALRDRAIILTSPTPAPIVACAAIAAVFFLLAWLYRSSARTWGGSLIALAGTVHALNYNYFKCVDSLGPGWAIALLGHATLAMLVVLCLDRLRSAKDVVRRAISDPLADSALFSSIVAVPALVFGRSAGALWLACCFPWLAAVWLVLAWRKRSVALFAAHQVALAFAALAVTTAWMKYVGWIVPAKLPPAPNLLERIASVSHVVLEPRNLQAYGIALGMLSMVWAVVRIIDTRRGIDAKRLLQNKVSVDWCIRHGVVALQWLVVAFCTAAEVPRELLRGVSPASSAVVLNAFGPTAWILLVILVVTLAATLWERWRTAELVAVLLLAATLPCLIAGRFAPDLAVAYAARWALAIGFVFCSVAVWGRASLATVCRSLGAGPFASGAEPMNTSAPAIARAVLVITMVMPVLAITVMAALLQIGGTAPGGPAPKTFFEVLGPNRSYLVPLILVIGALVGYALRERSSGYAFSAGLVLEMAVVLGYALQTSMARLPFHAAFAVTLIQLFAITAAAWAVVWLVGRKRLDVWREPPVIGFSSGPWSRGLMTVQISLAIIANVLVLGVALFVLSLFPMNWQQWSVTAGRPLGWIALGLPLVALQLRGRMRPHAAGLCGMAFLGLLACTIHGLHPCWQLDIEPIWGYRTLMLGWAIYALLVVAATWWIASLRITADASGPPQGLIRMAAVWVRVAGVLAVMLGLKAAFQYDGEQLWAAAAIAIASGAGATMAVWRRREGWAFAAALGVNLAASLVVWHFELLRRLSFNDYWLRLVQANVIASGAVAIAWLAVRKRLYELRGDRAGMMRVLGESPLLAAQIALPVIGTVLPLAMPVAWLIHTPDSLPQWMIDLAAPQGWIGLLLTAVVSAWYLRQRQPGSLLHVLGSLAIGAGVLAACGITTIYRPAADYPWIAYHVLTTAWAAAGLIVLAVAIAGRSLIGPKSLIPPWIATIGTLTVAMASLHAFHDPARPWWAAGAILTVSLTAGLVAMLLRSEGYAYVSGLLINLAGTIVWWAYSTSSARWPEWNLADMANLAQANALCLAIGSILWSFVGFFRVRSQRPFAHWAAKAGAILVALVAAAGVVAKLIELPRMPVERLDWIALVGIVTATAVCLLDRRAAFPVPALYGLGLAAIALGLSARQLMPWMFYWSAANELAGYALAAAVTAWLLSRIHKGWFSRLQAVVIAVASALALWVTIDFRFDGCRYEDLHAYLAGRMGVVPGLLFLLLAAIVMASSAREPWRARWQRVALTVGMLLLSGLGWATLAADGPAPWLHRSVILMIAATVECLLAGFALRYILPSGSEWRQQGRQAVPALAGLAIGMLAAVLLQEAWLFELHGGAPMVPVAIALVIAAAAGMIAGCLTFAVTPELDPLRLSDRGRQAYVYAAEMLAAAIGLHVWLTMPWLFKGYLVDYWMLIVMAIAFAGAGVSEWFHRRGMAVLSQPLARTALLLPLLPAVGFWLAPMLEGPWHLVGRAPAVWMLMALFYGVLSVTRRSWKCALLAVLSANLGLWVGLDMSGFEFLRNPQLFVIPVALAGLVAEYLNHDRLSEAQSTAFRYLTLSAIYISSTADMFIAGLGNSWGLPLVLMVLSVAGMLAGISFRVRSFLFLGLTFLVLDTMSMIWHAAHDLHHTWIWYVCGIALGAAILAIFAVFEKRRNDVLAVVVQLKDWAK